METHTARSTGCAHRRRRHRPGRCVDCRPAVGAAHALRKRDPAGRSGLAPPPGCAGPARARAGACRVRTPEPRLPSSAPKARRRHVRRQTPPCRRCRRRCAAKGSRRSRSRARSARRAYAPQRVRPVLRPPAADSRHAACPHRRRDRRNRWRNRPAGGKLDEAPRQIFGHQHAVGGQFQVHRTHRAHPLDHLVEPAVHQRLAEGGQAKRFEIRHNRIRRSSTISGISRSSGRRAFRRSPLAVFPMTELAVQVAGEVRSHLNLDREGPQPGAPLPNFSLVEAGIPSGLARGHGSHEAKPPDARTAQQASAKLC